MRIGILAQPRDRVPSSGSLAVWATEVATRLSAQHDITIYSRSIASPEGGAEADRFRIARIDTGFDDALERRIQRADHLLSRLLRRPAHLYDRRYYFGAHYAPGYFRAAGRAIRRNGEDVVVVGNIPQALPVLRRSCGRTRLALMMHCDWLVELPRALVLRSLDAADLVMGCSRHIRDGIRKRFPDLPVPVEALHNGSSPESLLRETRDGRPKPGAARSADDRILLFVGRLTPEKGVHVAIRAMQRVLERVPSARLLIAGGFHPNPPSPLVSSTRRGREHDFEEMKPRYRELLEELAAPLGDRVQFLSDVPHGQLGVLYGAADLFVHPAIWDEPFGMILTEAMAFGCPVVSTRAGGIPEIVSDGVTGLLVEPGDAQGLGEAIVRVLLDPALARKMGEAGRARVESDFTWDRTAARLSDLLSAVIAPDARGSRRRRQAADAAP